MACAPLRSGSCSHLQMVMLVLLLLALGVSAAQQPARPSAQSLGNKLAREARQVRERDSEKSVAECV